MTKRCRRGFTVIELILASSLIAFLAAIAQPTRGGRFEKPSPRRACFAIQKTLAGAFEMYDLDCNRRTPINADTTRELVKAGYLQSFPTDPGGGGEEDFPWVQIDRGNGIFCLRHGAIQPVGDPEASAYNQLLAYGIDEPVLLGQACTVPVGLLKTRYAYLSYVPEITWVILGSLLFGMIFTSCVYGLWQFTLCAITGLVDLFSPVRPWTQRGDVCTGMARLALPSPGILEELPVTFVTVVENARCPVCAEGYDHRHAPARACSRCRTLHHDDCLTYTGKCAIYGCRGR